VISGLLRRQTHGCHDKDSSLSSSGSFCRQRLLL